jgi:hypothetical protein
VNERKRKKQGKEDCFCVFFFERGGKEGEEEKEGKGVEKKGVMEGGK